MILRWVRFNLVGLVGFPVHLGMLALLTGTAGIPYLLSTAIAVETVLIHNFLWHQIWTWRDRPPQSFWSMVTRLLRFQLANGLVSLGGNLILMKVGVDHFGLPYLVAALFSIAACSLVNFLLSHHLVFRGPEAETKNVSRLEQPSLSFRIME